MSIRPLPDEVVAQIKSSTAIMSLSRVVLELLKNSLDAKASKIHVTVDFARGACSVEDDGLGIPPAEFSEDGGLGKLYYTSKFHSDESHLGRHGTFLASLSAMSLLTITSHHHAHRSHNSISFHHARILERQTPAPAHTHVYGKHGTRVVVRNLFGNMPVRVKQRAMTIDHKTEQHRLRSALRKDVVGLLLSWQGPVALKICDGDGNTIVQINTSNAAAKGSSRCTTTERPQSGHLSSLLQIMTQAKYIDIGDWASWVPASASTPAMSVKGAISLEPAPTKHAQFISFGLWPLHNDGGGNELYDQVNRLFALSSFGIVEDDADVDEEEKLRRLSDKRYKNDGYTNRQLKARKGVDRHPMFHLRVLPQDRPSLDRMVDRFIEDESNLQAVIEIFRAMITQWLSVHNFRPRTLRPDQTRTPSSQDPPAQSFTPSRKRYLPSNSPAGFSTYTSSIGTPKSRCAVTSVAKRRKTATAPLDKPLEKSRPQAFSDWSRIKSGKSAFFETTINARKSRPLESSQHFPGQNLPEGGVRSSSDGSKHDSVMLHVPSLAKGVLGGTAPTDSASSVADDKDETLLWVDPSTKKTFRLNARTGCVMPPGRLPIDPTVLSPSITRLNTSKPSRAALKSATAEPIKHSWLDGLLRTWDNPIFKPAGKSIQQVSLHAGPDQEDTQHSQHDHTRYPNLDIQKAFDDANSVPAKLSKDALRRAEVISQVDRKFILVRMASSSVQSDAQLHADTLVLVDQHAADERIQVEALLRDLCNPVNKDESSDKHFDDRSKPGSTPLVAHVILEKPLHFTVSLSESTHFEAFAAYFLVWGIAFNIGSPRSHDLRPNTMDKAMCTLSVTALPPAISERCKADPELLISFLRSAVWKYVESPPPLQNASSNQHASWVKKMATCPPGLVDMINSRACRSAIMFNDELNVDSCRVLITKLADCVFPFMCAHGRPSMVPIVDMGRVEASDDDGRNGNGMSFVEAWKKRRG